MLKSEIAALIIVVFLIGFQVTVNAPTVLKNKSFAIKTEKVAKPNPFANMEIEAKSAVVWDALENKILFAKNGNVQLPLASLTKIMTVRLALKEGVDIAVVTKEAISEEGDSGLFVGEKWQVPDLARLTLVSSSNDGASSLAFAWAGAEKALGKTASFVEAMNEEAKSLGLAGTYFLNATGLDISSSLSGAYGSAEDVAKLFYSTVAMRPDVFGATSRPEIKTSSIENKIHELKNTNSSVGKITGVVASKTGFTVLAGGNLVVLIDVGLNHPIAVVVLGSSENGRFSDVEKLAGAAIQSVF